MPRPLGHFLTVAFVRLSESLVAIYQKTQPESNKQKKSPKINLRANRAYWRILEGFEPPTSSLAGRRSILTEL